MHLRRSAVVASGSVLYGFALLSLDVALARTYGATERAAIFYAAYLVPSLLCNIASGGAIIAAYIPHATRRLHVEGAATAGLLAGTVIRQLTLITVVVVFCVAIFAKPLSAIVMSSVGESAQSEIRSLIMITMPILVFHAAGTVIGASLQAAGKFAVASAAPALVPGVAAGVILILGKDIDVNFIGAALLAGSIVQLGAVWFYARTQEMAPKFSKTISSSDRSAIMAAYAANVVSSGLSAGALFADQAIAGVISVGAAATFAFGTKLVLLFLAFTTTVVANSVLPHFSRIVSGSGMATAWSLALRWCWKFFVAFAVIAVAWYLLAPSVVRVLYEHGAFSSEDSANVSLIQRCYVAQIPFYIVGMICLRMLNAAHANIAVIGTAGIALAVDIILAWLLKDEFGPSGVAIAHSISICLWSLSSFVSLHWICHRRLPIT
jgi:putative peptidoglycan lipid II flippase